ncbi:MAG: oligosaccharide flippase family protein [Myxococcales bacterium]|nr:oligosaccharide flippase family protein [Myxococcales bacterium]
MSTRDSAGAGKGVLWLSGAKLYFMLAGAILQIALPALVSRVTFGAIAVVSSLVSPLNNLVVTGSIQTVARGLAAQPNAAAAVGASGLRMHLYVGLPLALVFAIGAPAWGWWLGDKGKALPTAMCALIVGAYAIYAVLVGLANGQKQFHRQAGLDVAFASMRVALMLGAAMLGLGVWGVLGGWVVASLLIIIVAAAWVGWPRGCHRRWEAGSRHGADILGACRLSGISQCPAICRHVDDQARGGALV